MLYKMQIFQEQLFRNYYFISGIYLIWTIISAILTLMAWTIEIIPMEANGFAPFFTLTNQKFVLMISFPYLFVLGIVFGCDMIALLVAIAKKTQLNCSEKFDSDSKTGGLLVAIAKKNQLNCSEKFDSHSKNFSIRSSVKCKFQFLLQSLSKPTY